MKAQQDVGNTRVRAALLAGALVGVWMLQATSAAAAPKVINCIGEQTTITAEGSTMAQNWPPVLGDLLGAANYTVNNDGVNTGKVIDGSAKSATSLTGSPSIVIIGPFAEHDYAATITPDQWKTAYGNLVAAYLALASMPTVYVMTPPPATFVYQSTAEQTFATDIVKPAVEAAATATPARVHVIDLSADAFLGTAAAQATPPDGHFNVAGMAEVAKLAYEAITGMSPDGGTTGTSGSASGTSSGTSSGTASGTSSGTASGATSGVTSGTASGTSSGTATTGDTSGTGTASGGTSGATTSGSIAPTSGSVAMAGTNGGGTSGTMGGGTSGTSPATAGTPAGSSGTGGTTPEATPKSSSGCTITMGGPSGRSSAVAGLLSILGLAFLGARKRSSRRS
jgi:hypothetical protein